MKKIVVSTVLVLLSMITIAQDLSKFKLYNPAENATQKIEEAIRKANLQKKHVFIQIGGNWCIWCARFHDFITSDKSIDSLIDANYIVYHLNYSDENFNAKLLAKYGFPQRFGFPVFLVLDGTGKLLHTQNSGYLEDGKKSYDKNSVMEF